MKFRETLYLVSLGLGLWLSPGPARAASTLIGTLPSVNGTTNSPSITNTTVTLQPGSFLISNGGLSNTNALRVNLQVSVDNTNFVNVATYGPSSTNATTDAFNPSYTNQTIYIRAQVVTTNAVNVGVIAQ